MPKILLIEDDPDQIFLYQSKFELEGFEFMSCRKGFEGLELAKKKKPDIVLLDLVLIAENGMDVLAKLKENPATKEIPVVILTNLVKKESSLRAKELGAVDYIVKTDVMPSGIVEKVKEVLKHT